MRNHVSEEVVRFGIDQSETARREERDSFCEDGSAFGEAGVDLLSDPGEGGNVAGAELPPNCFAFSGLLLHLGGGWGYPRPAEWVR